MSMRSSPLTNFQPRVRAPIVAAPSERPVASEQAASNEESRITKVFNAIKGAFVKRTPAKQPLAAQVDVKNYGATKTTQK